MIKIIDYKVNNLRESVKSSGLPMMTDSYTPNGELSEDDIKRITSLGSAKTGSGHDCALKGVNVFLTIKAPLYFWKQWDRYSFQDTVSSTSTMHKILEQDLEEVLESNVYSSTLEKLKIDIDIYKATERKEVFDRIISNLPQGYLYTRSVTTNYLQLKTMYYQRNNHKLDEWVKFCEFIKELPLLRDII